MTKGIRYLANLTSVQPKFTALWAERGWKLKLTRVHATEYGIYGTKYLPV